MNRRKIRAGDLPTVPGFWEKCAAAYDASGYADRPIAGRSMQGYRCSECGSKHAASDVRPGAGLRSITCPDHPAADILIWKPEMEAALGQIARVADMGIDPHEQIQRPLSHWPVTFSTEYRSHLRVTLNDLTVALALYDKWGGHPDRPARIEEGSKR